MSNKEMKTSISKATSVAEDINNNSDGVENTIQSGFIIVSANEISDARNNNISNAIISNDIESVQSNAEKELKDTEQDKVIIEYQNEAIHKNVVLTTMTNTHQDKLRKTTNKKTISSKSQSTRKGGPSVEMLNSIKQSQNERKKIELEAEEKEKQRKLLQKLHKQQEQEKLRLEAEKREKRKQKEKDRIERQRKEGSYLTQGQHEKHQRAQIQLAAAGIQIPERHIFQSTTNSNNTNSTKKRILYNDYQKTNTKLSNTSTKLDITSFESKNTTQIDVNNSSTDSWEELSQEENDQNLKMIKDNTNNDQVEININSTTDEESSTSESENDEESDNDQTLSSIERVRRHLERHHEICERHRSSEVLRAPVICVLGHVDAGKTTILDNLRRTHVQDNEAGGITQQIGATNVPLETIRERTQMCHKMISRKDNFLIPGLLIIDTPGHANFKNLRTRGSSLCDIAILVVDIMRGLEPQTIESIQLLIEKQVPFIIALNKIDLIYNWKGNKEKNVEFVLQEQSSITQDHFEKRLNQIIVQFAIQNLNVAPYYNNPDPTEFYSIVPTSARSGDGMDSLIAMIVEKCQTDLVKHLSYTDELQATVMEVKAVKGLGTTIDVALVNGYLSVGDKIIIAGQDAPIITQIRRILMPELNQELRVTNQYQNVTKIQGTCAIKILAKDLERSMAGLPLFVIRNEDEIDYFKNEFEIILKKVLNSIKLKEEGVYVQTSTLGSLEALLELLKESHIRCAGVNIGPVHRKDVILASTQLEKDVKWATILALDVKIERDAQQYADTIGVKILQSDKMFHLCQMFTSYIEQTKKDNKEKYQHLAVFPCKLKILPQFIFNSRDPIICGVRVEDGFLKIGTPICVPSKDGIDLGRVTSIQKNHKAIDIAVKGSEVCIKIESITGETPKMYGRHFDENDILMSKISRQSIDILKEYFREDMKDSDWKLIIELKKLYNII